MWRAHVMLLVCACEVASPVTQVPDIGAVNSVPRAPREFLKGQLHLHSSNSGDSRTPPEQVARWYADHGYDFIVFTDHSRVTDGDDVGEMLVLPGMEITMNVDDCV
ncbi:MAG: PHP domain-containing protein, partial [Deltaproteobacteria bacterium]|nr:PHP domain-containing protein [Nannocystaceae bacterium]